MGRGVLGVSVNLTKEYMIDKIFHYAGIMTRTEIIAMILAKAGVNKLIIATILIVL